MLLSEIPLAFLLLQMVMLLSTIPAFIIFMFIGTVLVVISEMFHYTMCAFPAAKEFRDRIDNRIDAHTFQWKY